MRVQVKIVKRDPINDTEYELMDAFAVDTETDESPQHIGEGLIRALRRVDQYWYIDKNGQIRERTME